MQQTLVELQGKHNTAVVFTDNVDEMTIGQVIELCNQPFVEGSKIRIMPDCLTEDTEVLTKAGFKKIVDLAGNEKIANFNPEDKSIFFSTPKNIIVRDKRDDEKIFLFENKQSNIRMTVSENHRMAIHSNMGLLAKNVEELLIGDMVMSGSHLNEKQVLKSYTDMDVRLIAWIVGDGNIKVTKNQRTSNYRIRFGFKKERKIKRVVELLEKAGLGFTRSDTFKQTTIMMNTVSSKPFLEMLDFKKEFPRDFMFLCKEQVSILFEELIQVDGDYEAYINNRGFRLNGSNTSDLEILQALAVMNLGMTNLKSRKYNNSFKGEEDEISHLALVKDSELNESQSGLPKRKVLKTEITYEGKLVCVECDTSYFIARQNGFTFITGNCHAGKGSVIGTTMTLTDKVVPNLVGVDIGCGMQVVKLNVKANAIDFGELDSVINQHVPSGMTARQKAHKNAKRINYDKILAPINRDRAEKSIGTLGGGNHFIEINEDAEGYVYLVIHSGSRNIGKTVAEFYQNVAIKRLSENRAELDAKIEQMKAEGRQAEIGAYLKDAKKNRAPVNKALAYVEGKDMDDYIHDLTIAQEYALLNRQTMAEVILENMGWEAVERFDTIHNYIDVENMILRKGAISAQKGEVVIIPMNMRDGSLICVGKGNPEWNFSGPHGAGRIMSRSKAKELVSLEAFEETMKDVWTTSVVQSTLDESPFAYKPMDEIIRNIQDSVEIQHIIRPLYNFKAK